MKSKAPNDDFGVDATGLVVRIRGRRRTQEHKPLKVASHGEGRKARLQRLVRYHTGERNQITVFLDPDIYKALCKEADDTKRSINELVRLRLRESYGIAPQYTGISLSKDLGIKKKLEHLNK